MAIQMKKFCICEKDSKIGVVMMLTPNICRRVWVRKKGFWRDSNLCSFDLMVPVFSTMYMSSGGQPAVTWETTVCCSKRQFLVNPINRGVFSGT